MKKRKKVIVRVVVLLAVLLLAAWAAHDIYMERPQRIDYADLPGGIQMVFDPETGTYAAEIDYADGVGINFDSRLVYVDPVTKAQYYRLYYYFTIRPIDRKAGYHRKRLRTMIEYYPDGRKPRAGEDGIDFYDLELYYVDKDGSELLFWRADNAFPNGGTAE